MPRKVLLSAAIILLAGSGCTGLEQKTPMVPVTPPSAPRETAETKTYANAALGYVITYPASWVNHDNAYSSPPGATREMPDVDAQNVFVAPKERFTLCHAYVPGGIPVRYLDIRNEEQSLETLRRYYGRPFAGADYTESVIGLAGKEAYLFLNRHEEPPCEDGRVFTFAVILVPNGERVLSITTDLYGSQDVRDALMSLRLNAR